MCIKTPKETASRIKRDCLWERANETDRMEQSRLLLAVMNVLALIDVSIICM